MKFQYKLSKYSPKQWAMVVFYLLLAVAMVVATVKLFPWFVSLSDPEVRGAFEHRVAELGLGGWFLVLGIQVLQILVAFIPGEPVEVVAGMLYGTWGGLFTCLAGILVGSLLVFYGVRLLGRPFAGVFIKEEQLDRFSFLHNTQRLEVITFLLFLIPGTPKDALTYVAGLTKIRAARFLTIATFARIPSVVTSTLAGATLGTGQIWLTVLIFALTGLLGIAGILLNRRLISHLHSRHRDSGDQP